MDKKLYKMMDWARVEQIVYSEEDNPHEYLGSHPVKGGRMISCFIPGADKCSVIIGDREHKMDKMDEEGFFSVLIRSLTGSKQAYRYKVTKGGETFIEEDPYRFSSAIPASVQKAFSAGIFPAPSRSADRTTRQGCFRRRSRDAPR